MLKFLEENDLYTAMTESVRKGNAEIQVSSSDGVVLYDRKSEVLMLAGHDTESSIRLVNGVSKADVLMVYDKAVADYASKKLGLDEVLLCSQVIFDTVPDTTHILDIRPATESDVAVVAQNYERHSYEELLQSRLDGNLFCGFYEDDLVGFVGRHSEGSLGILHIMPQYRRRGFAGELEAFMIQDTRKKGNVPYAHIIVGNDASLALQQKLGGRFSDGLVYWIF